MAQIENLEERELDRLSGLVQEMKKQNPDILMKTFKMDDLDIAKKIQGIEDKVDALANLIKHIFGEYVLIDGQFRLIKPNPARSQQLL